MIKQFCIHSHPLVTFRATRQIRWPEQPDPIFEAMVNEWLAMFFNFVDKSLSADHTVRICSLSLRPIRKRIETFRSICTIIMPAQNTPRTQQTNHSKHKQTNTHTILNSHAEAHCLVERLMELVSPASCRHCSGAQI